MKSSAQAIIAQEQSLTVEQREVLDEIGGWSPLDGTPPPAYVPTAWTVEHVGLRLVTAYSTITGPRWSVTGREGTQMGIWPAYQHDWADMVNWDAGEWRARPWEKWQKIKPRLTPREMRLVDQALHWPLRYLRNQPTRYARALSIWLVAKNSRHTIGRMVRKSRISLATHKRDRRCALDIISEGLTRDRVPVE
jgi:hypothetical protein